MWSRNPFDRGGWWGRDGDWFVSGFCSFSYWFTEGGTGCYRNRNLLHPFVERGEDVNCFSQLAMFHGALHNPDFPR